MRGVLLAERFRIGDRLGAGGMGEVWSAQDERMRRDVAVKLVQALFGMDEPETRARFQREVQLAGRLSHQNIVTVHDWGEVSLGGRPVLYLVMELVPGVSLGQRLRQSTPPGPSPSDGPPRSHGRWKPRTGKASSTGTSSPPTSSSPPKAPPRFSTSASRSSWVTP